MKKKMSYQSDCFNTPTNDCLAKRGRRPGTKNHLSYSSEQIRDRLDAANKFKVAKREA